MIFRLTAKSGFKLQFRILITDYNSGLQPTAVLNCKMFICLHIIFPIKLLKVSISRSKKVEFSLAETGKEPSVDPKKFTK